MEPTGSNRYPDGGLRYAAPTLPVISAIVTVVCLRRLRFAADDNTHRERGAIPLSF